MNGQSTWRRRHQFADHFVSGDKSVFVLNFCGPAGILLYSDSEKTAVAMWERTPFGARIWRDRISIIEPRAAIPDDATLHKLLSDIENALAVARLPVEVVAA